MTTRSRFICMCTRNENILKYLLVFSATNAKSTEMLNFNLSNIINTKKKYEKNDEYFSCYFASNNKIRDRYISNALQMQFIHSHTIVKAIKIEKKLRGRNPQNYLLFLPVTYN